MGNWLNYFVALRHILCQQTVFIVQRSALSLNSNYSPGQSAVPHLYVYRGADRRPAQYNELTLAEFVHGYLSMMDNPRNNLSREVMLNILKDMTLDAALYGWPH